MKRRLLLTLGMGWIVALALFTLQCTPWPSACEICSRPLHERTYFQIAEKDGTVRDVCCPRCGQRYIQQNPGIARSMKVTDFYHGDLFPAQEAFYVEASSIRLCCPDLITRDFMGGTRTVTWDRCLPSLVAFRRLTDAEKFQQEKGGNIRRFAQVFTTR
ncbi:MAG: hypothetical protein HY645_06610 [Acidobacteria bacterium]|nr:hypothetical protein [Acidobacteriota bacterium]